MADPNNSEAFRPRTWLRNGHAQTLWRKYSQAPEVRHRRQRVELGDGDFIDIDWHEIPQDTATQSRTIVLIMHGLCGCSGSGYIQSLQYRLGQSGYRSVAMNFRGCSGEVNRLARSYHSGVTADLAEVFDAVRNEYEDHEFAVVGYSLGANVLLKWLGETGRENPVRRAAAVSTPFNLKHCSTAMLGGMSRLYGRFFLRRLMADFQYKKMHFQETGNREQLQVMDSVGSLDSVDSLWDFDDRVTAPLHGFENASHYYEQCSSIHFLTEIGVPTLLLQSYDDPIIPPHALPASHHLSEHLVTDFSTRGGHVGFASATDPFWLENRIIRFIGS